MCKFVTGPTVAPGYGCCRCHTYNGLQRKVCLRCQEEPCEFEVPDSVVRCGDCGFGMEQGMKMSRTLAGRDVRGVCPVCGAKWPGEAA